MNDDVHWCGLLERISITKGASVKHCCSVSKCFHTKLASHTAINYYTYVAALLIVTYTKFPDTIDIIPCWNGSLNWKRKTEQYSTRGSSSHLQYYVLPASFDIVYKAVTVTLYPFYPCMLSGDSVLSAVVMYTLCNITYYHFKGIFWWNRKITFRMKFMNEMKSNVFSVFFSFRKSLCFQRAFLYLHKML